MTQTQIAPKKPYAAPTLQKRQKLAAIAAGDMKTVSGIVEAG